MFRIFSSFVAAWTALTLGSAFAQQPAAVARLATSRASGATRVPGVRPSSLTTIQGNALNSTNGSLPNTLVRLRDARFGKIVGTQLSDKSGLFAFRSVDPGSYVVEVMATDQATVLAASQLLSVNAGDAVSAVVKLPFRIPPFAGVLGNSTPSAASVTTQAAASGFLATTTGDDVSPVR